MSEQGSERRRGIEDFISALSEATRSIESSVSTKIETHQSAVERKLEDHAKESRTSLERVSMEIGDLKLGLALNAKKADEVASIVQPIPERLTKVETTMRHIEKENDEQWGHITASKDIARSSGGVMSERNVRLMIIMGIIVVVILGGVSGYNVLSKDNVKGLAEIAGDE